MPTSGSHVHLGLSARSWSARLAVIVALGCSPLAAMEAPPDGVSGEAWTSIQEQIEAERHRVTESDRPGRLYRADNPTQRFTAHFGAEDVVIVPGGRGEPAWELGLRLTAWGAAHDLKQVEFAHAAAEANRVEYRRGPLTEWYVNSGAGLEQGFTIAAPPGDGIDELVLEMTVGGDLTPDLSKNGRAVTFHHEDTNANLTYSGLSAWDAVGETLEAWMELGSSGARLRLVVSVDGTAWPITIDPIFTQVATLLPTPNLDTSHAEFGRCVAVDGEFMVVGMDDMELGSQSGAAHIFRRDQGGANAWRHVAKLTAADGGAGQLFGMSVAISGDTVIVGAYGSDYNLGSGSAYIFQRDHGGIGAWGQVTKISATYGKMDDRFGRSVAISGDTAVVGAFGDDENGTHSGSAFFFDRNRGGTNNWGQATKVSAIDAAAYDQFGQSVAISGDTAFIGAPFDDDAGIRSGSAYIFRRGQSGPGEWGQIKKINTADGAAGDVFGSSVAITGDTAIVGAPGYDDNGMLSGSAYIFDRNDGGADNWGQVAKITPPDGAAGDYFGGSVAISGDTVVAGSSGDDANGSGSGSAFIFQRDHGGAGAWGQVARIKPADGAAGDSFGGSVSISGANAVVGAKYHEDSFSDSGSAYIFSRDQGGSDAWGQTAKLPCPPVFGARGDYFGWSVSISGDTAVVGAYGDDDNGDSSGSAYVFQRDHDGPGNWGLVAKITPGDGAAADNFGWSVAVSGDTAIVGAWGDSDNGERSGSAYIFQSDLGGPDNWRQIAKITAADGARDDLLGWAVAISGDTAVVGSYGDDDFGSNSGSVYVFHRDQGGPGAWGQIAKITAADGAKNDSFGASVAISGDTAIVGSYGDDDFGSDSGSVYVFHRDQGGPGAWGQIGKITAADGTPFDRFGWSVAISGDTAVVGSYGDDDNDDYSGSVSIFQRNQGGPDAWGQVAEITNDQGTPHSRFGRSVAICDDIAVAGVVEDIGWASAGQNSARVFRRNQGGPDNWGRFATLVGAIDTHDDLFGWSVAVSGDTTVVGAPGGDRLGEGSGSAYVFVPYVVRSPASAPRRLIPQPIP